METKSIKKNINTAAATVVTHLDKVLRTVSDDKTRAYLKAMGDGVRALQDEYFKQREEHDHTTKAD